jgi:uncharacterized protein YjbI with pentapeptide repeats
MVKPFVIPPNLSDAIADTQDMNRCIAAALRDREDLEHLRFRNETFRCDDIPRNRIEFSDCVFERCAFDCREARTFSFVDVSFIHCDLSNVSFHKSAFVRVSIADSKALGASFSEAVLNNVSVRGSLFRYANFTAAKMTNLLLEESDFSHCFMEQCKLKSVRMEGLNLEAAEFSFTPLKDIDLTACAINGITANALDLRGAVIASHQAVDLAGILGVVIRDGLPQRREG